MKTQIKFGFSKVLLLISLLIFFLNSESISQECESTIEIQLKNIDGGVFANQKVTLSTKLDGTTYNQNSDVLGKVSFNVPCNTLFDVFVSNYTDKNEIQSPRSGLVQQTLSYEATMVAKAKEFEMNLAEISKVDQTATLLPDTTFIKDSKMLPPKNAEHFARVNLTLKDIQGLPLSGEVLVLSGIKRNKSYKGTTDIRGNILFYIVKGDTYQVNFKHNKNYSSAEYAYTKGTSKIDMSFSYLGTKEIEKRKKEEKLRILEEEKRLKAERDMFTKECKKKGISIEEGYRRLLRDKIYGTTDTVVINVLNRNKWLNKLIVCDLTGSMQPYAVQLSIWYQLNYKKEQNLQFVFFNDGDEKKDNEKIIGETGGIYYSPSKGIDSLSAFVSRVSSRGSGGDCPENNMEALIKGVNLAKPFKEIVSIVDNHAPVKDISLLSKFNQPVHIILCGAIDGWVLEDYLLIAWKTKGSIHTIEQDITNIAKMSEGQEIKIGKFNYRIMGGEFVRITKK